MKEEESKRVTEDDKGEPLSNDAGNLDDIKIENKQDAGFWSQKNILIIVISIILLIILILALCLIFSKSSPEGGEGEWETLPNCEIHEQMTCSGSSGDMKEKFKDNLWNTPKRGSKRWLPGFQDMSLLVGYVQQKYSSDMKKCNVSVYTKTAKDMELYYYFDGEKQKEKWKEFNSDYKGILKVVVRSSGGEELVLDDVDFVWNSEALKEPKYNTLNGQKGAIVEMFGWPDDDIAKECKFIGEAGYMGVKVFPHQEQVMSYQPFNDYMNPWYFMYQPISYKLNGRMGNRTQLRNMIKQCRKYGVRVYADAVVNHMSGNGNDLSKHRNPGAGCNTWGNKTSSAEPNTSPFFTPAFTYEINPFNHRNNNVLEFPAVPYGPMDFHCEKALNAWTDPENLNTGWLTGLSDLDTSKEYVRQRIADFFTDLISIGFSGFRVDAAKHIHPKDLAAIFRKFKDNLGGSLPADFITWLEVLTGGESWLLVQGEGDYSFTGGLTKQLRAQGMTEEDIEKIKIWWAGYPVEPNNDNNSINKTRKVIQNDDHDQQNPGSSSRDMHDEGCVLIKGCSAEKHRAFEVKIFKDPKEVGDNKVNYPIRLLLSSYYFTNNVQGMPDGLSDCTICTTTCDWCKSMSKATAYVEDAPAYGTADYTRVHRDAEIIKAMADWMNL